MKSVWVSWSSGKDSAWTFYTLQNDVNIKITGIFTTINEKYNRVAMHGTRFQLLQAQALQLKIPLYRVDIPDSCSNEAYEAQFNNLVRKAENSGVTHMAFGDLFLKEVRIYREKTLQNSLIDPLFPLWEIPTAQLGMKMIANGLKAVITCVDTKKLPERFVGREYDENFLSDLPSDVDPCGENGEFHTCVYAGPFFAESLPVQTGKIHHAGQFCFIDVVI